MSIAGGDAIGQGAPGMSSAVYSFLLQFDNIAEAEEYITKFIDAGGEVTIPFGKEQWGDHFGQVTDRFGVLWMFNAADA